MSHRDNPFPGLRPFELSDAPLFFGRDGQSDDLLKKLSQARFVAVVGTSGSGKSSLVKAGLLPALYSGITGAGSKWRVALIRPGRDPLGTLAIALNSPEESHPSTVVVTTHENLADNAQRKEVRETGIALTESILRYNRYGLIEAARQTSVTLSENLLIVVDQFEELFRYSRDEQGLRQQEDAATFVDLLLEATRKKEFPIFVIITMRDEFLSDCTKFWGLPEAISDGQYLIPRMNRDARRLIIEGPVEVARVDERRDGNPRAKKIAPTLVNCLLNDAGDSPEQLPVLQHALMRTWDEWAKTDDYTIDLRHYNQIGRVEEALNQHAEQVFDKLPDDRSKYIAKKLFQSLVEKDAEGRTTRRPCPLGTVCEIANASLAEVASVIVLFQEKNRSFLAPPPEGGLQLETVIDISHESLIKGWRRLEEWAAEEHKSSLTYERLAEKAQLYEEGETNLYQGRDLDKAMQWYHYYRPNEGWSARYHGSFNQAISFLIKSRNRSKQRKMIVGFTSIVLILSLLVAIISGLYAKKQANQTTAIRLASEATDKLTHDPHTSLILAVQAVEASTSEDKAVDALRRSLVAHSRVNIRLDKDQWARYAMKDAAFGSQDNLILTINTDGNAYIWTVNKDSAQFSKLEEISVAPKQITCGSYSKDGDLVAVGDSGQQITVWEVDTSTGKLKNQVAVLVGSQGRINDVSFSPDSRFLVAASSDGVARIWDVGSRGTTPVAELKDIPESPSEKWIKSAVFSPQDGRYVLTASWDNTVQLWSWDSANLRAKLSSKPSSFHLDGVNNAAFSPDGKYIVTASNDMTAQVWSWDPAKGDFDSQLATIEHPSQVLKAAFDPHDSKLLVTACADNNVRIWRWFEANPLDQNSANATQQNAADSATGNVALIENNQSEPKERRENENYRLVNIFKGHTDWVNSAKLSADGRYLVTASDDGSAQVWEVMSREGKPDISMNGPGGTVVIAAFDPTGARILIATSDGREMIRNTATGESLILLNKSGGSLSGAFFNNEGNRIFTFGRYTVRGWLLDFANRTASQDVNFDVPKSCVAMGVKERKSLITCENARPQVWDISSGKKVAELSGYIGLGNDAAFSSVNNNLVVMAGSDNTARVWDISQGNGQATQLYALRGHTSSIRAVSFSPDGKWIATGDSDGTIRIWDVNTGTSMQELKNNSGSNAIGGNSSAGVNANGINSAINPNSINSVIFGPDSNYIVTSSLDNTITVWEINTRRIVASWKESPEDVSLLNLNIAPNPFSVNNRQLTNYAAFSPDGRLIVTARNDNTAHIYLWNYYRSTPELLEIARHLTER
jgi:WD40 repeat protein